MRIIVPGTPVAEARVRLGRRGHAYNPKGKLKDDIKESIYLAWADAPWIKNPHVSMVFYYPLPKALPKKYHSLYENGFIFKESKPDIDNLVKMYLDAMTGICYEDDNACSLGFAFKSFSQYPRTVIWLKQARNLSDSYQHPEGLIVAEQSAVQSYKQTVVQPDCDIPDHLIAQRLIGNLNLESAFQGFSEQPSSRFGTAPVRKAYWTTCGLDSDSIASHPA